MVEETVTIKLLPEFVEVDVDFLFRNEGEAQTVSMSFPDQSSNEDLAPALKAFRSSVDGRRVRVQRRYSKAAEMVLWTKRVAFGKKQNRRVRVSYQCSYTIDNTGYHFVNYIFTTGASWMGSIGKCTINLDWQRKPAMCSKPEIVLDYRAKSNGWRYSGTARRTITLRDYEPHDDLQLRLYPGFWNFRINGVPISQQVAGGEHDIVRGKGHDPLVSLQSLPQFFGGIVGGHWADWGINGRQNSEARSESRIRPCCSKASP